MALTVNTNIINDTDQYLLDAKNVKGGFIVVDTTAHRDALPTATIVNGSLCYCVADSKFYQYNGSAWKEKVLGITTTASTSAAGLMSTSDKSKLDGIAAGAEVNVQSDWNATSGDAFIKNKPTIPTALKSPNALTIIANSDTTGLVIYDGSAAKSFRIKPSTTAGAFIITDGTTEKTIQLAGKFTDTTYTNATASKSGLMSSTDKSNLDTLVAAWTADGTDDTLINKIQEVLNAFENAPEGTNIVTALAGKADKSSLATVATSGSYNDLSNKPTIPTVPGSLKNPYSLTIQGNGTTLTNGTYDGSAAKTVNITPAAIGAAASSHGTHVTKDTVKSALGAELITNISEGNNKITITKGDGSTTTLSTTYVFSPMTAADGNVQYFVNSNIATMGSINEGLVTYDPATRTISNSKGALNITGNAATANTASKADEATKATNDGVGNNIRDTYALKDHGTHVTAATVKSALGTSTGTSKYLREDGTWVTPSNTDTWRKVQLNGTDKLGTGTSTKPLNIKAGKDMSITESSGTFTFNSETNFESIGTFSELGALKATIAGGSYTRSQAFKCIIGLDYYYGFLDVVKNSSGTITNYNIIMWKGAAIYYLTYTVSNSTWTENTKYLSTTDHTHAYADSDHTHDVSIAKSSATNELTLAHGTKYALTAGGQSFVFTMPSSGDTDKKTSSGNTSSKIFLVGATSQSTSGQTTYSHDTAYVGTDGAVYSESAKVLNVNNPTDVFIKSIAGGSGYLQAYDASTAGNVKADIGTRIPFITSASHTAASLGTASTADVAPHAHNHNFEYGGTTGTPGGSSVSAVTSVSISAQPTVGLTANTSTATGRIKYVESVTHTAASLGTASTGTVSISGGSYSGATKYMKVSTTAADTGTVGISGGSGSLVAYDASTNGNAKTTNGNRIPFITSLTKGGYTPAGSVSLTNGTAPSMNFNTGTNTDTPYISSLTTGDYTPAGSVTLTNGTAPSMGSATTKYLSASASGTAVGANGTGDCAPNAHTHSVTVSGTTGANSGTAVKAVTGYASFSGGSLTGTKTFNTDAIKSIGGTKNYGFSASTSNIMTAPTVTNGVLSFTLVSASTQDAHTGTAASTGTVGFTAASLGTATTADVAPSGHTHSYGSSTALTTGANSGTKVTALTGVKVTAQPTITLTANTSSATGRITYVESQGTFTAGTTPKASASFTGTKGTVVTGGTTKYMKFSAGTTPKSGASFTGTNSTAVVTDGTTYYLAHGHTAASLTGTKTFATNGVKAVSLSASTTSTDGPAYTESISGSAPSLGGTKTFVTGYNSFSGGSITPTTKYLSASADGTAITTGTTPVAAFEHSHNYSGTTTTATNSGNPVKAVTGYPSFSGGSSSHTQWYLEHKHDNTTVTAGTAYIPEEDE